MLLWSARIVFLIVRRTDYFMQEATIEFVSIYSSESVVGEIKIN